MFAIGDIEWPGLSKLVEEAGEVLQISGNLMGSRGDTNHWRGDLREMFIEELGDLIAAIEFFMENNFEEEEIDQILDRADFKADKFERWHENDNDKEVTL